MDCKAFNRLTNFKGGGSGAWLKWIKKFESLIDFTYPTHGRLWLKNIRNSQKMITPEQHFKVSEDLIQENLERRF